jgi:hypothetical protein
MPNNAYCGNIRYPLSLHCQVLHEQLELMIPLTRIEIKAGKEQSKQLWQQLR